METLNRALIYFVFVSILFSSTLSSVTRQLKDGSFSGPITRFEVCNKTVEKYKFDASATSIPALIKNLEHGYSQKDSISEILQLSIDPSRNITFRPNGFVSTVLDAYAGHHNLVLRPDDIWTAIMTQFSFYLNKNAEKYRHKFVKHTGQKELVVTTSGTLRTTSYSQFVQLMTAKIDENLLDKTVKDWVLPSFSTTTENDIVSVGVIFMASLKHYFSYKSYISCGIPAISLEGTVQDWKDVHRRLGKLKEFDLGWWYAKLDVVLRNLIAAKEGHIDSQFWNSIVNINPDGCGTQIIHGWLTTFSVFDDQGNQNCQEWNSPFGHTWDSSENLKYAFPNSGGWFVCDLDELPHGMAGVNVKIVENGQNEYNSTMYGGHFGLEVVDNGYTLRPTIGWVMALLKGA